MVDALLNAAHSDDSEYFEDEHDDVPQQVAHSHVRTCEFCGSSNTPTWRRGPGGKGSLCNACGIKWRLRKRTKKGDQGSPTEKKIKIPKTSPPTKKRKKVKVDDSDSSDDSMAAAAPKKVKSPIVHDNNEVDEDAENNRKNYYCKYCNKTWDINYFKNSQQFGAHCSNCSRKPRQDGSVPQSPAYYKDSGPTNLILILRYLQDELSDLEDEDTITPSSPVSPVTNNLNRPATVPQLPSFSQLQLPLPNLSLRGPPPASYDPLNTLRLAANECWPTAAVG